MKKTTTRAADSSSQRAKAIVKGLNATVKMFCPHCSEKIIVDVPLELEKQKQEKKCQCFVVGFLAFLLGTLFGTVGMIIYYHSSSFKF